jgi:hypothetical protein
VITGEEYPIISSITRSRSKYPEIANSLCLSGTVYPLIVFDYSSDSKKGGKPAKLSHPISYYRLQGYNRVL